MIYGMDTHLTSLNLLLKSNSDVHKVPCYCLVGDRRTNILLTRIRNVCSCLNADLNRVNLTDSPVCNCVVILVRMHIIF